MRITDSILHKKESCSGSDFYYHDQKSQSTIVQLVVYIRSTEYIRKSTRTVIHYQ
jgi:hypothetical protein